MYIADCVTFIRNIHAEEIKAPLYTVEGTTQILITAPPIKNSPGSLNINYTVEELSGYKTISLMQIKMSPEMEKDFASRLTSEPEFDYSNGIITS